MRARFVAIVLPFVLFTLACEGDDSTSGSALETSALRAEESMAGGNKVIGVMSRNLYLGADLGPVIAATDIPSFLKATTGAWLMVQKNDFHLRVKELADEIAAKRPALVGLQEAFTWRTQNPGDGIATPAQTIAYDYVPELLAALAARGVKYRDVASIQLLDVEAPTLDLQNPTQLGIDVRATDHDVILAREDVHTSNKAEVVYDALLPVPIIGPDGQPHALPLPRGYVAVDVKYRGESLRLVSTHLESFHPGIRQLQAAQLAASLSHESRPVILVGDLNSQPGTEGEAILAGAGFDDVWSRVHPGDAGLTCCWAEDLTLPESPTNKFDQRIDYVLTRGLFRPVAAAVTGANPSVRVEGLWPSDHGGIFAAVRIRDDDRDDRFDR